MIENILIFAFIAILITIIISYNIMYNKALDRAKEIENHYKKMFSEINNERIFLTGKIIQTYEDKSYDMSKYPTNEPPPHLVHYTNGNRNMYNLVMISLLKLVEENELMLVDGTLNAMNILGKQINEFMANQKLVDEWLNKYREWYKKEVEGNTPQIGNESSDPGNGGN